ncbi:hypothetical protein K402DRAFT_405622 [Aulographum hederae CBS 113979]|uniref:Uncharacterized protein n=1 Tax=Aulographum hederae CBS 113979 TaxID=1176131 RepID=A0A6G1GVN1_9PEZI|nr:hypothetical protein K402DRAFT_405622 [Aulographum hederae CBS 113979]
MALGSLAGTSNITSNWRQRKPNQQPAVPFAKIREGDVIWAGHFAPLLDQSVTVGDPNRAESTLGALSTKSRPMIVLRTYKEHLVALPLLTWSGRSLAAAKAANLHSEYAGMKWHRDIQHKNEAPHAPIEVDFRVKTTSLVHLVAPYTVLSTQSISR